MVIVIVGPTGVGKTKLSIELAKKLNGEIINADSTQIFKGLDIGTAKVTEEEKENILHHLFDIKNIDEDYTVFDYQKDARNIIKKVEEKNKQPIMVGGTGLYIKACIYDYRFEKEFIKYDYSTYSNEELYEILKKIDPNSTIHINNRKRIERAITYYKINNEPISKKQKADILIPAIIIGLTAPRNILYEKINRRVDKMLENGLEKEAKKIYDTNIRTKAVMTPICYKELFEYFDLKISKEEAIEKIKKRSRNYAKRQYTFFNNQLDVKWFNTDFDNFDNTVNEVINYIKSIDF